MKVRTKKMLYKKQVRPLMREPMLPGVNQETFPLYDGEWYDCSDDLTILELFKSMWEREVKKKDRMSTLVIEERFVDQYAKGNTYMCEMADTIGNLSLKLNLSKQQVINILEINKSEDEEDA